MEKPENFLNELSRVEGDTLNLRLISAEDADFLFNLRTSPLYGKYLSKIHGGVDGQRRWIKEYKKREEALQELYYIIERKDGVACGTVRLYEIGVEQFFWGSWILSSDKPRKAALESSILSLGVGFDILGIDLAKIDVRIDNERARAIYERLGMLEVSRDQEDIHLEYSRGRYYQSKILSSQVLSGFASNE